MTRYLSGIRKQLQDVSDLFTSRYGKNSNVAEIAVKALVSATLLEHEMLMLEHAHDVYVNQETTAERSIGAAH